MAEKEEVGRSQGDSEDAGEGGSGAGGKGVWGWGKYTRVRVV